MTWNHQAAKPAAWMLTLLFFLLGLRNAAVGPHLGGGFILMALATLAAVVFAKQRRPIVLVVVAASLVALFVPSASNPSRWGRRCRVLLLTDQASLARAAGMDSDLGVRRAAAARLADQKWLVWLAVSRGYDFDADVRKTAIAKLDQVSLIQVAAAEGGGWSHQAALMRIDVQACRQLSALAQDPNVRFYATLLGKLLNDCESQVPAEHRARVCYNAYQAIQAMRSFPPLIEANGDVEDLHLSWEEISASYSVGPPIKGEHIKLSIKLSRARAWFSGDWPSAFPRVASVPKIWQPARMLPEELIRGGVDVFSEPTLAKIATSNWPPDPPQDFWSTEEWRYWWEDRRPLACVAADKLTDQELLAKVALDGETECARDTAINKLNDRVVLTRLAAEAKDEHEKTTVQKRIEEVR